MSERSSVDPLVTALENEPSDHGFTAGWRAMIAASLVIGGLSFLASVVLFAFVYSEGHTRERQFCAGQLSALRDKEHQLEQTREFLGNVAGQSPNDFNDFVRNQSLPRLTVEVQRQRETFPRVCRKYQ